MHLDTGEVIIHEGNWRQFVTDPIIDGEQRRRGLIPRNYETHPVGFYATEHVVDMPTIPEGEWEERLADMIASQSLLSDVRNRGMDGQPIPALDQNGKGYCWMHSGCGALLLVRAGENQPFVDLSAYMGACIIKGYQDEGGWGAQGLDWICKEGLPSSKFWPQRSMSRSNDTPEMRANAKLHRVTEGWMDLAKPQYDRNLTWQQRVTCWLTRTPTIDDYNYWGHSVCGMDLVSGKSMRARTRMSSGKKASLKQFEKIWAFDNPVTAGYGHRLLNSWGGSWGANGAGIVTGNKALADGCTAPRSSKISPV